MPRLPDPEALRWFFEATADPSYFLDPGGAVEAANEAAHRLSDVPASALAGRPLVDLVHPDDRAAVRAMLAAAQASGAAGCEARVLRGGCSERMRLEAYRPAGSGLCLVARDLERRRAAQSLESVLNHVIDGVITIDAAGRIQSFNPAAEKIFSYTAAEVTGRNVKILMPDPYHDEHDGYLRRYMETGEARIIGIGREVVGRRKDGSRFPMDLAVSTFELTGQRFFTGIARDITERKRLEQELHQSVQELADAAQHKNDFLAMLAHELRNPLAPIRNAVHILTTPAATEEMAARARAMLERQVQQVVRLVDDLLDVSRIVGAKIELRKKRAEIRTIVEHAVETAEPVLDARGHQLEVQLPAVPVFLEVDTIRIAQVISNLLTNAARYTEHAGLVTLAVTTDATSVQIRVRDTGIGIEPELLPRIFDLFVQGDRSLVRSTGGLGVGLTLVRHLVEMHGGSVTAASAGPGRGSEFTVQLPRTLGSTPAPQLADPPRPRVPATSYRVLVVDDNVDSADSVAFLLELWGHQPRVVHDGPTAITAAIESDPHLVLIDIGLPGMDGYEVARRLRALPQYAGTVLVALTGYGHEDARRRSREAGFDHHLTKPVDPETLQSYVATLSEVRR